MTPAAFGQTLYREAACPIEPNSVDAAIGIAITGAHPNPGSPLLKRAIAYPAAIAANQAPNTTCFCRLTVVWSLACSAGTSNTAAARTAGSSFPRASLWLASTAPRTARTRIRLVHTYALLRTVVAGTSDCGRARVLVVMPSQYSRPP